MSELAETIEKLKERKEALRSIGVDITEALRSLEESPRNTCNCNGIAAEAILKDVWNREGFKGEGDKLLLNDLITRVEQGLKQKDKPPLPRRVRDKLCAIRDTRNRASHHHADAFAGLDGITRQDAVESLQQLAVVIDWYFEHIRGEARPAGERPATKADTAAPAEAAAATAARHLVIFYKRGGEADEQLVRWLETQLLARGCSVFIDRHIDVGVEWAVKIDREIRQADFVIVLLSAASINSEMIAHEVVTARDAAAKQGGKPRILPVRVQFSGALRGEVGAILNPLQQFTWNGPQDNMVLVEQVQHKLDHPDDEAPRNRAPRFEPEGGAVQIDSQFYVVRPADDEIYRAIAQREGVLLIKGPRQIGKTSLLSRALDHARGAGFRVAITDFQSLSGADLASPKDFWLALGERLADQLGIDKLPHDLWRDQLSANRNFERYFRSVILEASEAPLLWAMDEADRLFPVEFSCEAFGLFRTWYNARALEPTGPWRRLTMAIVYATEAQLFIRDLNQSPFNIGRRFTLHPFTLEQTADLNARYRRPLGGDAELDRFQRLTGGHPFLVRRGLREMADREIGLGTLEFISATDDGPFGDQLKRILVQVCCDPALTETTKEVLAGAPCRNSMAFFALRESGILAGDSPGEARWSCEIFGRFLRRHLV